MLRWQAHNLTCSSLREKLLGLGESRARSVRALDLTNNQLEALPDEMQMLQGLERLVLQQNQLQTLPTLSLPKLQVLNAAFNRLEEWPVWVLDSPLEKLALNDNELGPPIPEVEWTRLDRLVYLSLEGNRRLPSSLRKFFDGRGPVSALLENLHSYGHSRFADVPIIGRP